MTEEGFEECCGAVIPYTGGQSHKREDDKWHWKFYIKGDQRGSGTNLHETMEDAVKDFEEVIGYSMAEDGE